MPYLRMRNKVSTKVEPCIKSALHEQTKNENTMAGDMIQVAKHLPS
jgi:hypothetical protein